MNTDTANVRRLADEEPHRRALVVAALHGCADEIERLRAALREIADGNPCTCDPAYSDRGLTAPDCQAALAGDDAREALGEPFECRGRKASKPNPRLVEIMQRMDGV